MKKRILSTILSSLLLLTTLTACSTAGDTTDTEAGTQSQTAESDTAFFPDVEKNDYEGATFRIISAQAEGQWYYAEEYKNEAGNTGVLNNTIYEMNTLVEEHLGVTLEFQSGGDNIYNIVYPTMMAGDDTYQLCANWAHYDTPDFITTKTALDFYELDALDLDQPYWNADVMDTLAIHGHAYVGFGDLCYQSFNVIYCNKDMLEDVNMAVPYEDVRQGKWTLDKLASMTSGLYRDNGDGLRNNLDIYGYAGTWNSMGSGMLQAADIYVLTKNNEGEFELSLYGDRLVEMYNKLYRWTQDESTWIWAFAAPAEKVTDFKAGQGYFTGGALSTEYLDTDIRVGILPLPKYDEAQENYCHVNWGNNLVVPTTVRDHQMVGEVMELMAFYSSTLVLERYYDEVLQLRVSEAPDDRDMVVLVYDTAVFDPAITFSDGNPQLWNLIHITYGCVLDNNANIASYYQKNAKSAEKWLNSVMKKLSN
jgi:hypothetical protein